MGGDLGAPLVLFAARRNRQRGLVHFGNAEGLPSTTRLRRHEHLPVQMMPSDAIGDRQMIWANPVNITVLSLASPDNPLFNEVNATHCGRTQLGMLTAYTALSERQPTVMSSNRAERCSGHGRCHHRAHLARCVEGNKPTWKATRARRTKTTADRLSPEGPNCGLYGS